MISTIVLDLDGPLLEGKDRHYRCYSDILSENSIIPIAIDEYWHMKRARIDRRKLLERSNAGDFYDEFFAEWMKRIETKPYLEFDRLQDGALNVLSEWRDMGICLLLATMRNHQQNLEWQLDCLGFRDFFDDIIVVGSDHGSSSKSDKIKPKLADVNLGSVLWIGDTEVDVSAARELGVKVCALTCGLRERAYLEGLHPDFIDETLSGFIKTTNIRSLTRI